MTQDSKLLARAIEIHIDGGSIEDHPNVASAPANDDQLQAAMGDYRRLVDELRVPDDMPAPDGGYDGLGTRLQSTIPEAMTPAVPAATRAPSLSIYRLCLAVSLALMAAGWTLYFQSSQEPDEPVVVSVDHTLEDQLERLSIATNESLASSAELRSQTNTMAESLEAVRVALDELADRVDANADSLDREQSGDSFASQLTRALRDSPGGDEVMRQFEFVLADGDARVEAALQDGVDGEAYRILNTTLETYRVILQVTANNLANAQTAGFKRDRVTLEDIGYKSVQSPDEMDMQDTANSIAVGLGSRVATQRADSSQ
ncbi:MAG: hypothetical protein MI757_22825, partial [Pirellulales bacterium]|nr:hypothetical protein [Pirellulales bacterium]